MDINEEWKTKKYKASKYYWVSSHENFGNSEEYTSQRVIVDKSVSPITESIKSKNFNACKKRKTHLTTENQDLFTEHKQQVYY